MYVYIPVYSCVCVYILYKSVNLCLRVYLSVCVKRERGGELKRDKRDVRLEENWESLGEKSWKYMKFKIRITMYWGHVYHKKKEKNTANDRRGNKYIGFM